MEKVFFFFDLESFFFQNGSLDTDIDLDNDSQDPEIELFVNNVVCSFALSCKLNLRKIAMEGANVIYERAHAV